MKYADQLLAILRAPNSTCSNAHADAQLDAAEILIKVDSDAHAETVRAALHDGITGDYGALGYPMAQRVRAIGLLASWGLA
jgi:hypothetical protein